MIIDFLKENADEKFGDFQARLMPNIPRENIIGVRTPLLRKYAKEIRQTNEAREFLITFPHKYFDENQLHAFLLCETKDFTECIRRLMEFLPYIDNWATCDQLSPKVLKKHKQELLPYLEKWLDSGWTYITRFAIGLYMELYLDEDFKVEYLEAVSKIRSDEYYVNMQTAWLFATALAKHRDETLPFIENRKLDRWTHNKTIQKARESKRISEEDKQYLNTLKY